MRWAVGVTTVPERAADLLPATLMSLERAGFPQPRLFVDGACAGHQRTRPYDSTDYQISYRFPRIGAWGNFYLGLLELVVRNPEADRFAMFQDDVIACRDLRAYLDRCVYPDGGDGREPGFWNLYTVRNAEHEVGHRGVTCGWIEGPERRDRVPNDRLQLCRGALGLVFNREAATVLLAAPSAVGKAMASHFPRTNVDGAVITAFNLHRACPRTGRRWEGGWREYVHGPSLLQHAGTHSTVKEGKVWTETAATFRGEGWSALEMLAGFAGSG